MMLTCDKHLDCVVVYSVASRQCPFCAEISDNANEVEDLQKQIGELNQELCDCEDILIKKQEA